MLHATDDDGKPRRFPTPEHRAELLAYGCVEPGTEQPITFDDDAPDTFDLKPAPLPDPDADRLVTRRELDRELEPLAVALVALQRRAGA